MGGLGAFFGAEPVGERVIGTYLYPYRLFSEPDWDDPYSATAVVAQAQVDSDEVLITRNGGLFVRPSSEFSDPLAGEGVELEDDLGAKLEFEAKAAASFNRLICELALNGIVSEPATPVHISRGKLIENHALITSAGGGREIYVERSIVPSMQLLQGTWRIHPLHVLDVLKTAARQECTLQLVQVSKHLPALVAGAYSLFSRRQLSEALIDSWIVVEQVVDRLWADYLSTLEDKRRRDRLSDSRTHTAAVRIELLHCVGILPSHLYGAVNTARKHRNDLAHRARINLKTSTDGVMAMKGMIEFVCQTPVEHPSVSVGVNW